MKILKDDFRSTSCQVRSARLLFVGVDGNGKLNVVTSETGTDASTHQMEGADWLQEQQTNEGKKNGKLTWQTSRLPQMYEII